MVSLEACGCTEGPLGTGHLDKFVNRIPSLPCAPFESPITLPFSPGILQSLRFPRVCTCSRMASLALCRARPLSAAFFGLVIGEGSSFGSMILPGSWCVPGGLGEMTHGN